MSMFGTQANTIRQTCRACHNICFTPEGSPSIGREGYRCEACETAGYERRDFDKSLPPPHFDAEPVEAATPVAKVEEASGSSPSPDPVENADSEARPSVEPKSGNEGELVETAAPAPEAE